MPPQSGFTFSGAPLFTVFPADPDLCGRRLADPDRGSGAQPSAQNVSVTTPARAAAILNRSLWENFRTPLSILLVQIIVILIMAGLFRSCSAVYINHP